MDTYQEIEEVKPNTPDVSDEIDNPNEFIVPPQNQEQEKETPAESSTAETPSEEPVEQTEVVADDSKEPEVATETEGPKPVEGETLREKALRLEVERLRRKNKEIKKSEIFPTKQEPIIIKKDDELADYDPADLERFAKVAKKIGFVLKDEVVSERYNDVANAMLDEFLDTHKEYAPENDKDDLLWKQFQDRFSSGLYNTKPSNPKQFKAIFERIHEDIFGSKKIESNAIAAKQEKIKSVSHQSGIANAPAKKAVNIDQSQKSFFKGFDDDELNDLLS